jgi:peptidoglycan lytic transglycosylase G
MSERSSEEREVARRERERRRLEREQQDSIASWTPSEPAVAAPVDDWLEEDPEPPPPVRRENARRPPVRRPLPPRAAPKRRHSRGGRALALLAILGVALVLWFLLELFQPFTGSGRGEVTVTIPPHASTSQIANILDRDGVISCTFPSCTLLFELRAKLDGRTLLSGTYHLKRGMSFEDAIGILSTPPPAAKTTEVTITPGRTRTYIAAKLRGEHVAGSYLSATKRSRVLKPTAYGAPASTPDLEGFLFPDTYQLRVPINIGALVADQLKDFKRRFKTVNLSYARSHHLTAYDVLIVASLAQAEAEVPRDFPLVASVVYNRLRDNMRLEFDSTTRYATGNYNHPLTVSQLHSNSPWNTHTHAGLPPTPINNPALAAIQAAAHPARTNYLYFVSKPCKSGALAFSASYSQFLVNVRRLQNAHGHLGKC